MDEPPRRKRTPWAKAAAYSGLAFILPISMYVCHWVGSAINDRWGGVAGLMVGFAGGLWATYREAVRIEKL
jgi:hypothetical protein